MLNKLIHWFSHYFGKNEGDIISWHDNENFYISFKCKGCGKIDDKVTQITKLIERPE